MTKYHTFLEVLSLFFGANESPKRSKCLHFISSAKLTRLIRSSLFYETVQSLV